MADLAKVKRNVAKMVSQGAPETDIDAYISGEGTSIEAVRQFKAAQQAPANTNDMDFGLPVPKGAQGHNEGEQFWQEQERLGREQKSAEEKALEEQYGKMDLGQRIGTFAENTLEGVPVVGPLVQRGADAVMAETVGRLQGYDPAMTRDVLAQNRDIRESRAPVEAFTGNMTGAIASMGKLAQTQMGKQALGLEGKNAATRYAAGIGTNATLSGADTLARGGSLQDAAGSVALGGGLSAAMPIASKAVKFGADKVKNAGHFAKSMFDPAYEGARRVVLANSIDQASMPSSVLNQADEATARLNGQNIMNVDRGGETTRALARSAANTSPEFRGQMEKVVSDRYKGQAGRAIQTLTRLVGGNVDDLKFQSQLKEAARAANKPAYLKAYQSPKAQAMWDDNFSQLMRSPALRSAVKSAETSGANRSVAEGIKPVKNPFVFNNDGSISLRKLPDGSVAKPNLAFWDQVQRDLRKQAEAAGHPGSAAFNEINGVRQSLNNALDNAVTEFKDARIGAAAFFGADDALDAGKKFARNRKLVPEAKAAFEGMKDAEKKAFQAGYSSEMIDTMRAASDNRNIVQQMFGNPAARELNEMVLGKNASRELEAFVRVEDIMDKMRGAMGNSKTAQFLHELGMAGGVGATGAGLGAVTGQDWQTSLGMGAMLALGRKGAATLGGKIDERVLKEVGRILLSNDPKLLAKAQFNAMATRGWMKALEAYGVGLEKALPIVASRPQLN
ncbi:hypothetical protein [Maritalea porphyrae]|uniref:hypothetical protein n=1 Tax=Maritalea porphyrae TaxID=880732 RepID=UPI0022AEDE4D|nr:hypothetical protein [Maritalea porphyrae]MCZ4270886.1 hypothetical protein [Maritalea porphyrae]